MANASPQLPSARKKDLSYYIRYYLNVDRHTIQGRLTIGFLSLGGLAVLLALASNMQWKDAVRRSEYALNIAASTRMHTTEFKGLASQQVEAWKQRNLYHDATPETDARKLTSRMAAVRDTLARLAPAWHLDEERLDWADADRQLAELQKLLRQDTDSAMARATYQNQIKPALAAIHKRLTLLLERQSSEIAGAHDDLATVEARMEWLMPLYVTASFALAYLLGFYIIVGVLSRIKFLKRNLRELGKGNLPGTIPPCRDEMNAIVQELNLLTDNLREIQTFAGHVGKGEFDKNSRVFDDQGDLGTSLARMREELKNVSAEEKKRSWTNEGLAHFSDILRSSHDIAVLSEKLIQQMVKYLHANQGGLFVIENEGTSGARLHMRACYAYNRKKFLAKEIEPGQGLIGQVWLEGETVYLREIPADYLRITSGLGDANPRYLLAVPLKVDGRIEGVMELASFHDFAPHEIRFAEKVAESIASTLSAAKVAESTSRLLAESQELAEEMKAQEEEMRQNMEELAATQEEMNRSQKAVADERAMLDVLVNNVDYASLTIDTDYRILAANTRLRTFYASLGVTLEPGVHVLDTLRAHFGDAEAQRRKDWYDRAFAGETYVVEETMKIGDKTLYLEAGHKPIVDAQGRVTSITVTGRDVSAYRYKQLKLEKALQHVQQEKEALAQQVEEWKAKAASSC